MKEDKDGCTLSSDVPKWGKDGDADAKHEEAHVRPCRRALFREIAWGARVCAWQWLTASSPEKPPPSSSPYTLFWIHLLFREVKPAIPVLKFVYLSFPFFKLRPKPIRPAG